MDFEYFRFEYFNARTKVLNLTTVESMLLQAIHLDDLPLMDRLIAAHNNRQTASFLTTSDSVGSTNTLTDLAQRRHGNTHRRSNASSTISTHSSGRYSLTIFSELFF